MLVVNLVTAITLPVFWKSCWVKLVHREKESALSQLAVMLSTNTNLGRKRATRTDRFNLLDFRRKKLILHRDGFLARPHGEKVHTVHQATIGS